jgi:hypothetical protein
MIFGPVIAALTGVVTFNSLRTIPAVVSSFGTSEDIQVLSTSYELFLTSTIAVTGGRILGQCSVQIINGDNIDHVVDFYIEVNGSVSNVTSEDIRKRTGGVDGAANLFLIQRSGILTAGTYELKLFGKSREVQSSPGTLTVNHIDFSGLGNLS